METPRNYDQKCPLVLVLDASGSMSGDPIDSLNNALISLKDEITNDSVLSNRLELAIVTFDDEAEVVRDFDLVLPEQEMPTIEVGGVTNMFSGINKAIDIIENRKEWYKNSGQPYYRPIIVLFSDGSPTNADSQIEDLDQKIQKMSDDKKFMFMPFGVGDGADMETLGKLAAQTADQRLKEKAIAFKLKDEQKFAQVFAFVSASASAAMSGGGGATVSLDPDVAEAQVIDMDLGL
jgi:uncharacterized protein YegL